MHGLIFETSVCYWQNQPGYYRQTHTRQHRYEIWVFRLSTHMASFASKRSELLHIRLWLACAAHSLLFQVPVYRSIWLWFPRLTVLDSLSFCSIASFADHRWWNRLVTDYFRGVSTSAGNQNTYDLRTLPDSHYAHYLEHARMTTGWSPVKSKLVSSRQNWHYDVQPLFRCLAIRLDLLQPSKLCCVISMSCL